MTMNKENNEFIYHTNHWFWGTSVDIISNDGKGMVCVKFDKKTSPKTAYICDLSVFESSRNQGNGEILMQLALATAHEYKMTFARLYVNKEQIWLKEWYERLGFKELSRDENELEMIKEL